MKKFLFAAGILVALNMTNASAQEGYFPPADRMPAPPPAAVEQQNQPYTGSFGPNNPAVPPVAVASPVTVSPEAVAPVTAVPAAVTPVAVPPSATKTEAAPLPPDPCAAYMISYDAYAFCQDRLKKIERMKEAKTKRDDSAKARYEKMNQRRNGATPKTQSTTPAATAPDAAEASPETAKEPQTGKDVPPGQ